MVTTDESDEHAPVVGDWPKGVGEASWWPLVVVLSVVGIYVGCGLYLVGVAMHSVVRVAGVGIALLSVVLLVIGGLGWVYQGFVREYWQRAAPTSARSMKAGMVLFLASDVVTFSALFTYYFVIRFGSEWSQLRIPGELLSSILVVNTAALFLSSITYVWGERNLRAGKHRRFLLGTGLTLLLGVLFVAGQALEYYTFITREGFTLTSGVFASGFFTLTGLHGLHVVFGVALLSTVLVRGIRGQYSGARHLSVTTVGWYWHFVDAVWLFLVSAVYLGSKLL